MRINAFFFRVLSLLLFSCLLSCSEDQEPVTKRPNPDYETWSQYLGDPGRTHFSRLGAFTPENVDGLSVVWEHELPDYGQMQMNPIVVDSV
ncbi:MAG: pyrroloquinoline quinone-dependent dehydrogenase, partial [Robiginitalea sp.]|nr:pyrroloquinoline quinone-dependent dehydrogenase [Robiginitalea sp.]